LEGFGNDLSSYANWLYENKSETRSILDRIKDCQNKNQYELLLKDLADITLGDKEKMENDSKKAKIDSIYEIKEPFNFREPDYCYYCGEEYDGDYCYDCNNGEDDENDNK
jgi:hypothetical protein